MKTYSIADTELKIIADANSKTVTAMSVAYFFYSLALTSLVSGLTTLVTYCTLPANFTGLFPLVVAVAFIAVALVSFFYGDQWRRAGNRNQQTEESLLNWIKQESGETRAD